MKKERDPQITVIPMEVRQAPDKKAGFSGMYEVILNGILRVAFVTKPAETAPEQAALQEVLETGLYPFVVIADGALRTDGKGKTVLLVSEEAAVGMLADLQLIAAEVPYLNASTVMSHFEERAKNLVEFLTRNIVENPDLPELYQKVLDKK